MTNLPLKRAVEWKIFESQAALISDDASSNTLSSAKDWLQPVHFAEVVEERAGRRQCGHPLCSKQLASSSPSSFREVIDFAVASKEKEKKDKKDSSVEVADTRNYCSKECKEKSELFYKELDDTAPMNRKIVTSLTPTEFNCSSGDVPVIVDMLNSLEVSTNDTSRPSPGPSVTNSSDESRTPLSPSRASFVNISRTKPDGSPIPRSPSKKNKQPLASGNEDIKSPMKFIKATKIPSPQTQKSNETVAKNSIKPKSDSQHPESAENNASVVLEKEKITPGKLVLPVSFRKEWDAAATRKPLPELPTSLSAPSFNTLSGPTLLSYDPAHSSLPDTHTPLSSARRNDNQGGPNKPEASSEVVENKKQPRKVRFKEIAPSSKATNGTSNSTKSAGSHTQALQSLLQCCKRELPEASDIIKAVEEHTKASSQPLRREKSNQHHGKDDSVAGIYDTNSSDDEYDADSDDNLSKKLAKHHKIEGGKNKTDRSRKVTTTETSTESGDTSNAPAGTSLRSPPEHQALKAQARIEPEALPRLGLKSTSSTTTEPQFDDEVYGGNAGKGILGSNHKPQRGTKLKVMNEKHSQMIQLCCAEEEKLYGGHDDPDEIDPSAIKEEWSEVPKPFFSEQLSDWLEGWEDKSERSYATNVSRLKAQKENLERNWNDSLTNASTIVPSFSSHKDDEHKNEQIDQEKARSAPPPRNKIERKKKIKSLPSHISPSAALQRSARHKYTPSFQPPKPRPVPPPPPPPPPSASRSVLPRPPKSAAQSATGGQTDLIIKEGTIRAKRTSANEKIIKMKVVEREPDSDPIPLDGSPSNGESIEGYSHREHRMQMENFRIGKEGGIVLQGEDIDEDNVVAVAPTALGEDEKIWKEIFGEDSEFPDEQDNDAMGDVDVKSEMNSILCQNYFLFMWTTLEDLFGCEVVSWMNDASAKVPSIVKIEEPPVDDIEASITADRHFLNSTAHNAAQSLTSLLFRAVFQAEKSLGLGGMFENTAEIKSLHEDCNSRTSSFLFSAVERERYYEAKRCLLSKANVRRANPAFNSSQWSFLGLLLVDSLVVRKIFPNSVVPPSDQNDTSSSNVKSYIEHRAKLWHDRFMDVSESIFGGKDSMTKYLEMRELENLRNFFSVDAE